MISYDLKDKRFDFRVAGVCTSENRILPGGRVELMEDPRPNPPARDAGELGCEVFIGNLLWAVESFFDLGGRSYHEMTRKTSASSTRREPPTQRTPE